MAVASQVRSTTTARRRKKSFWQEINLQRTWPLYVMIVPSLVALYLFSFRPMYGVIIAFQDFQPLKGFNGSPWAGLKHFRTLFELRDFGTILRNTLLIAGGKLVFTQLAALVFALSLNEVRHHGFKRATQTLVYLPHFLSWVILAGLFLDILSLQGIVNRGLELLGFAPVSFFSQPALFPPILIGTHVWKEFGWGAIIYLAALTNVDPGLYEAAAIDGAGRWRRIWNVALPGIAPIMLLVAVLSLQGVLDAGFDQILNLYNPAVRSTGDVIDTFVYRMGIEQGQFSFAAAVGLFKSVIAFILIVLSSWLAKRYAGYRVF